MTLSKQELLIELDCAKEILQRLNLSDKWRYNTDSNSMLVISSRPREYSLFVYFGGGEFVLGAIDRSCDWRADETRNGPFDMDQLIVEITKTTKQYEMQKVLDK